MKSLDSFYGLLMGDVFGCPYPVADTALRMAAREFCEGSRAIREQSIARANGTRSTFEFDLPEQQELVRICTAKVGDYEVVVNGYTDLDSNGVTLVDQQTFTIRPTPETNTTITIMIATKPTITATQVADDLVNRFIDQVVTGAKARLFMQNGTKWSNHALGAIAKTEFQRSICAAANEAAMQRLPLRTEKSTI